MGRRQRHRPQRGWRVLHVRPAWVIAAVVGLLAISTAWLVARGLAAQRELVQGRMELSNVRSAVGAGDLPAARKALTRAGRATAEAHRLTSDPVWRIAGAVPWLGETPRAVTVSAGVADRVTGQVLPPLVHVADALDLAGLRTGSRVDVTPLAGAATTLRSAAAEMRSEQRRMQSVGGPLPPPVRRGVWALRAQVDELAAALQTAADASRLLPPMLGMEHPRRYLLVIQNPAEARGTGGLIGAYGVVAADSGRITLRTMGPNGDLSSTDRLPIDLGGDYRRLYGKDPALWGNANMSPHFPYAARIWLALWQRQHHQQLDGVIAADPVALGHLVGAVGPLTLADGTVLTGKDTARFVMQDAYARFPLDRESTARDRLLLEVGRRAFLRLTSPDSDSRAVIAALRTSVEEHRVRVFSTRPDEEAVLLRTALGGGLPSARVPFLAVVVNNGAANKLDVYLQRSVQWQLGPCYDGRRGSRITIRLANAAPTVGLPAYAAGRPIHPPGSDLPLPKGSNRLLVYVYTSRGSIVKGAELDGEPMALRIGRERGLTVTGFTVDLNPGGAKTAVLQLSQPAVRGTPTVSEQPLVLPQRTVIQAGSCRP